MASSPTSEIIARAAEWAAALDSDDVAAEERAACEAWCRQDPMHRLALERMQAVGARFDALDDVGRGALRNVLARTRKKSRFRAAATAACVLLVGGLAATSQHRLSQYFPDVRTGRGEQREVALADRSTLLIDTDTAVDARIEADARTVTLHRGRILATVAPDPTRPFTIETADGTATALGTAFIVERDAAGTLVTVIESQVRACAAAAPCVAVGPGERVRLSSARFVRLAAVNPDVAAAWSKGWLEVDDRPLTDVLRELARYHPDQILFDPEALRGVHVTGSYPLREPDRALAAIAKTTGLTIQRGARGLSVSRAN